MTTISISQLKLNPSAALALAGDFPVKIQNRNKLAGYFVGPILFEKIIEYLENIEDEKAIAKTDFSKGTDFEEFASTLGI